MRAVSMLSPVEFEVDYVDAGAVRHHLPLVQAAALPFEYASPARSFASWRGQRNNTGWWWFSTTGEHVGFESWLERDHVMLLDFDASVTRVASQPFWLRWTQDGKKRSHVPDYFVKLADGTGLVMDCRPADRIPSRDAQAFAVARRACDEVGWRYRLVHDPDPVYAANVRWLAGYRHPRHRHDEVAEAVLDAFSEPRSLFSGARACGETMASLPVIYHLLWCGELTTDLTVVLSPQAVVSTGWAGDGRRP